MLLALAYSHGSDPYAIYNGLDADYRPLAGGERKPPPFPSRVRHFVYGCAIYLADREEKLGGVKKQARVMRG